MTDVLGGREKEKDAKRRLEAPPFFRHSSRMSASAAARPAHDAN